MFNNRPFKFSLVVLILILTFYSVGKNFADYLSNPQFDLLLKALSGLWVSLVILGLAVYFGQFVSLKDYKIKSFMVAFVSATLIGVLWQLIVNFYKLTNIAADDYSLKAAISIFTNSLGGALAHFYFVKRKKNKEEPTPIDYPFKS